MQILFDWFVDLKLNIHFGDDKTKYISSTVFKYINILVKYFKYINDLGKKQILIQKSDIWAKYFTTSDYNRCTVLNKKIKEKALVDKSDVYGVVDNSELKKKIEKLATKAELKNEQDKITKSKAFDLSYIRGKSHFEDDVTQNYLVFKSVV